MQQAIAEALSKKGYRIFTRPFELNIVGIRAANPVPDAFDDSINVFYTDSTGRVQFRNYPATTDPGLHWLKNPMNSSGSAILKPGQYINSHAYGMHRGLYLALVQHRPVTVYRDFDRNGFLDFSGARQETGLFGINIHRAQQQGRTKIVDQYSAGCQVFADAADFAAFIRLGEQHKKLYGNNFTYTLIEEKDLSILSILKETVKKNTRAA